MGDNYYDKVAAKMKDKSALPKASASGMGVGRGGQKFPLSLIVFRKYDVNEDGVLSKTEFEAFSKSKGYFVSETEFVTAFAKIDKDGSGDISYDEFKSFWADEDRHMHMMLNDVQKKQVETLFNCFEHFDTSKDGKLDAQEFKNLFKLMTDKGFKLTGTADDAFKAVDVSKDGDVEFPELLRYFIEKFGILNVE